ncbi:GNAT family N-acetyltransferase [Furfurilactobacillus curtus]|uniref:N-acetyltransferase domain-containing protein n=1 Tax=Furfurilactobacillus curtus TaxID=1746200 RepID=A0ABQ5JN72_9LACO
MKTETSHYFALSESDQHAIAQLSDHYWPGIVDDPKQVQQLRSYYEQMLVLTMKDDDGQLVGSLKIPSTSVVIADHRYQISGLSEVMVAPKYRRKGFGISLIMTAFALIQHDDADFSIFTCAPDLVPFYEQGGWTSSPQTVLIGGTTADPIASDKIGTVAMLSLFTPSALDHQAAIAGATIALEVGERIMW